MTKKMVKVQMRKERIRNAMKKRNPNRMDLNYCNSKAPFVEQDDEFFEWSEDEYGYYEEND